MTRHWNSNTVTASSCIYNAMKHMKIAPIAHKIKRTGRRAQVAPILCRNANRLPGSTLPIIDCQRAAQLPYTIPPGAKPRHGRSTMAIATMTIMTAITIKIAMSIAQVAFSRRLLSQFFSVLFS